MSGTTNNIPYLDAGGEIALKLVKLFVFLPQANPHPQFPNQAGPLALVCKCLALPSHLEAQVPLDDCFQELSSFRSDEATVGLCLSSLAWVGVGGSTPDCPQFPK